MTLSDVKVRAARVREKDYKVADSGGLISALAPFVFRAGRGRKRHGHSHHVGDCRDCAADPALRCGTAGSRMHDKVTSRDTHGYARVKHK